MPRAALGIGKDEEVWEPTGCDDPALNRAAVRIMKLAAQNAITRDEVPVNRAGSAFAS